MTTTLLAYVKKTRPVIARRAAWIALAYAVLAEATRLVGAIKGAALPGASPAVLAALFAPTITYMGARTVDAFSTNGKDGA